jgi:hypothetical protein
MSYKLREVQVTLPSGVVVTADVGTVEDVRELLSELELLSPGLADETPGEAPKRTQTKVAHADGDTPEGRVETRADLAAGSLRAKNVLAFKDGIPQLLRPTAFSSVADASVALLFSVEAGLKKNCLEFDAFKGLYESQNIKSGSPVSMLLTNLRNAQYLDSKLYSSERKLRLTAKGETKAIEVLKALVGKSKQ